MHEAKTPEVKEKFRPQMEHIEIIESRWPGWSDVRNFSYQKRDVLGNLVFGWKYDAGRVLLIRMEGNEFEVKQRLVAPDGDSIGIASKITFDGKIIPFDTHGEVTLKKELSSDLWKTLLEIAH